MYRIRKHGPNKGNSNPTFSLTVPRTMAEALPPDILYVPEFTEEGILFKAIGTGTETQADVQAPAWAVGLKGNRTQHGNAAAKAAA